VVRKQLWHHITQRDEDAARARIKAVGELGFVAPPNPQSSVTATTLTSRSRNGAILSNQQRMILRTTAERSGCKAPTAPTRFSSASEVLAAASIDYYHSWRSKVIGEQ
jgi:hypothetical protein